MEAYTLLVFLYLPLPYNHEEYQIINIPSFKACEAKAHEIDARVKSQVLDAKFMCVKQEPYRGVDLGRK